MTAKGNSGAPRRSLRELASKGLSRIGLSGLVKRRNAVVVSFYAGDPYYAEAAARLRARLDTLGMEHDIVGLEVPADADWIDICRRKIAFYRDMLLKHERPIIWMDVDSEILRRPEAMLRSQADITCFLRNYKYLPTFDPAQFTRLIAPPFLGFGYNKTVLNFLKHAVALERKSKLRATDDFYLQEALTTWGGELRFMLLRPSDLAANPESPNYGRAYFMNRDSGNVVRFKDEAEQHAASVFDLNRQKRVLSDHGALLAKARKIDDAIVFYRRAFEIDANDTETLMQLLELLRRKRRWSTLESYFKKLGGKPRHQKTIERVAFLSLLDRGLWDQARDMMAEAEKRQSANFALMQSRWQRYDLDRRASEMGAAREDRVPIWWMETPYPGNFGDIINPYVIEGLTGIPPVFSRSADRVLAIGSIIKFAKKGTRVWGAGSSSREHVLAKDAIYNAVRGPLTRDVVLRAGGECPEIYGDAAWFMPQLYSPRIRKTHKLGIILHHVHLHAAPDIDADVRVIDIRRVGPAQIEAFIDELLSCEAVLSTSLHGVILAHAYGVPVRWCVASTASRQISGDGMKFEDYFLSVGRSAPEPLDISTLDRISVDLAKACADNPITPIDIRRLAEAAPFTIRSEIKDRINRRLKAAG